MFVFNDYYRAKGFRFARSGFRAIQPLWSSNATVKNDPPTERHGWQGVSPQLKEQDNG
jgi:hypothetical protein